MEQIKNRHTGEIMCDGLSLKVVIEKHVKYLHGESGGVRAELSDANLRDADLRGTCLSGAYLRGADLRDAHLGDADLRGCPVKIKDIHKAIYAAASKDDALDMDSWHCGTTHCRAGWVVELAGEGGKALEWAMGAPAAAAMIYMASDPKLEKVPDFYASNEDALEDMKSLAGAE